jgi:succinoglycan biosynthesis transport protein ExoP
VPQYDPSQQTVEAPVTLGQRIDFVRAFLHRRYLGILICLLIALPVGAFYAFTSPKTYTASATMMIETRKGHLESQANPGPLDLAWFETQLQNLKSLNVLSYVVKQLHLADDPEFLRAAGGLLDRVSARLGRPGPELKTESERVNQAIEILSSGVGAQRIGQSYMIRIDFRGRNPDLSAKIANEMVNAYIFDRMNAKYQSNRRAGDWLQERLQNLRDQAAAAERAVVQFKAKNNMVASEGTLISEKQLTEISGQLGTARARAADLQARLERMEAVRKAYQTDLPGWTVDESVSEAMSNGIISQLRTKYLDLANRQADWSVRYGANHIAVVNLRNQIRDIRRSIYDELNRIEETYKSEYEIAKKRQGEVETALGDAVAKTQGTNEAQVTLFSLEAAAKSYRSLYDSFLRQHTEAVQEQTYPVSDARLISSASVTQTGPQTLKTWLITIFAGGMLGVGFGALREVLDRGFRTGDQVKSVLNTDCLALIPRLGNGHSRVRRLSFGADNLSGVRLNSMFVPPALASAASGDHSDKGHSRSETQILWTAVSAPNSPYADAMRSIKLAVDSDGHGACNVIGLTSFLPTEGKSTVAAGIATLMAQAGRRTVLVDLDVRNPSLSRALTPDAQVGFLEVVDGAARLDQAVRWDPSTKLAFLPTLANQSSRNATEMLASAEARRIIDSLKAAYECVIVDLAPLISTVDIRAVSRIIDSYVLVIEWGATKMESVQYALSNAPAVQSKMIGAVLNKVDLASLGRYQPHSYGYHTTMVEATSKVTARIC